MLITRPQDSLDTSSLMCDDSGGFDYGPDISGLQDDITNIYNEITNIYNDISGLAAGGVPDGDKGDITVSGTGLVWTIDSGTVTYDKIQDLSDDSILLGRGDGSGAGPIQEIILGTGLSMTGNVLNVSSVGLGDVTGPSGATDNAIVRYDGTSGKLIQNSLIIIDDTGNVSGVLSITIGGGYGDTGATIFSNGNISTNGNVIIDGTVGASNLSGTNTGDQTITLTGDVTGSGTGSFGTVIPNNTVTYAKMQSVSAASRLLGRGSSGIGNIEEIILGSNLNISGTTINATFSAGDVTGPNGSTNNSIALYDGTDGKLLKSSVVIIDSTGNITDVNSIEIANGYSNLGVSISSNDFGEGGIACSDYVVIGNGINFPGTLAFIKDTTSISSSDIIFYTTALDIRWKISINGDESGGGNTGSNFSIYAADDTGLIETVLFIPRLNTSPIIFSRDLNIVNAYGGGGTTISEGLIGTYRIAVGDDMDAGEIHIYKDTTGTSVFTISVGNNDHRWINACTDDESGGDSGSNWYLNSYDDTGGYETVIYIPRKFNEELIINRPVQITGDLIANNLSGINTGDTTAIDGGSA